MPVLMIRRVTITSVGGPPGRLASDEFQGYIGVDSEAATVSDDEKIKMSYSRLLLQLTASSPRRLGLVNGDRDNEMTSAQKHAASRLQNQITTDKSTIRITASRQSVPWPCT
jgi:hypothetical protein